MTTPTNTTDQFPRIAPSNRSYKPAQYPVKAFKSESGVEVRILYGSQPTGATLQLQYQNLLDNQAELFIEHFRAVQGTFQTFYLGSSGSTDGANIDENSAKAGWNGDPSNLSKNSGPATENYWRYAEAPQLSSVKRGVSSVTVNLVAVL